MLVSLYDSLQVINHREANGNQLIFPDASYVFSVSAVSAVVRLCLPYVAISLIGQDRLVGQNG
jgi:hypothetical protein